MSTVSGKWKWNDNPVISGSAAIEQNVDFVSDKTNCTVIHINDARVGRGNLGYDGNGFANKVVYGAELGNVWLKEEFKTIDFGTEEQTISGDFYTYLTANATQQEEPTMPTVSGTWKWNDTLPVPSSMIVQKINFTSGENGVLSGITIANSGGQTSMLYIPIEYTIYNSGSNLWFNEDCKTMDFGSTEQEVSEEFYNYLTANATKQEEPVVPTTTKTVSSDNLARFKQKCDETYAAIGNIPTVSTELVNLGTLSTSGTLTTDQVTQIGTTTIGVTARASVNSVTRFYERVNISGTTAMLVSADDDALHVLTVNLSTRAYTLSDVALGGDSNPTIPTPTTSDNGKVLGVANGAYALQAASGGGTQLYGHSFSIECTDGPISWTGYLTLICSKPERFNTPAEIAQYFLNKGAVAGDWIPCNGYASESSNYSQIIALRIVSTTSVSVFGYKIGIGITSITATKSYDVIPL